MCGVVDSPRFPQKAKESKKCGILELWERPELRWLSITTWILWSSFAFLYFGVVIVSANVLDESDSCNFNYPILLFASVSEIVSNLIVRTYVDAFDRRITTSLNFLAAAVAVVLLPAKSNFAWLLVWSSLARCSAYAIAGLALMIT